MSGNIRATTSAAGKITTVVATAGHGSDTMTEITYTDTKVIGNGSFGVVFQARMIHSNELVAIKKVLQDRRFKNRELQIMRKLEHCNIVQLMFFFYTSGDKRDEVYLNLVLEYMPETLYKVGRQYSRAKQTLPVNYVRLYMYQLFRSLAFIHSQGICHRDIKPQNLLLNAETAVLKLCDFGSAKQLVHNEPNVSYICSRYYRAPELIFGAVDYSTKIDMWSAGCVMAELLLGQLIFPGDSGVDQIVEIVKVMGTPTNEQLHDMNPSYKFFKLPQLRPHPWNKVFRIRTSPEAIDLVSKLLVYTPNARISPMMACAHPFFNELRNDVIQKLPNGRPMPPLFNFTDQEIATEPSLVPLLLPKKEHSNRNTAGSDPTKPQQPQSPEYPSVKAQKALLQQQPQPQPLQQPPLQPPQQQPKLPKQVHIQLEVEQIPSPRSTATAAHQPRRYTGESVVPSNVLNITLPDIGNGDGINVRTDLPTLCRSIAADVDIVDDFSGDDDADASIDDDNDETNLLYSSSSSDI